MTRGEIWWIDFGLAFPGMPQGRRPGPVVQNDNFNVSNILTTVIIPITTNTFLSEYKDNIFLSAKTSGLSKDSVVITPQIGAFPKVSLFEKVSKLSPSVMKEVDKALVDFLKL